MLCLELRIKLKGNQYLTLVSVYAPTQTNDDCIKEQFYDDLDKVIRDVPTKNKLVIMGDFNARVGSNSTNWKGVLGPHGVGKESLNGILLLAKCAQHQLAITGTLFRQKDKYKATGNTRDQNTGTSWTTFLCGKAIFRMCIPLAS